MFLFYKSTKYYSILYVGNATVDRLPVLVSSSTQEVQLLGVPKFKSGTGKNQARAVADLMQDWKIADRISAMVFDTTYSNTGVHKGACVELERMLGREMLWLPCRHHIIELVMTAAWDAHFGSTGPTISLFSRFQKEWPSLHTEFKDEMIDLNLLCELDDEKGYMIKFIEDQLCSAQPRDDYRELLVLSLKCLGMK